MNEKEIEMERINTHIEYLKNRGYVCLDIKGLPADPWGWDELLRRGIVDAVRAGAQEYHGGHAE